MNFSSSTMRTRGRSSLLVMWPSVRADVRSDGETLPERRDDPRRISSGSRPCRRPLPRCSGAVAAASRACKRQRGHDAAVGTDPRIAATGRPASARGRGRGAGPVARLRRALAGRDLRGDRPRAEPDRRPEAWLPLGGPLGHVASLAGGDRPRGRHHQGHASLRSSMGLGARAPRRPAARRPPRGRGHDPRPRHRERASSEELFFRGLLATTIGLIASSLAFGLLHQMRGRVRWVWAGWATVMGLLFGALFLATGSLLGPLARARGDQRREPPLPPRHRRRAAEAATPRRAARRRRERRQPRSVRCRMPMPSSIVRTISLVSRRSAESEPSS